MPRPLTLRSDQPRHPQRALEVYLQYRLAIILQGGALPKVTEEDQEPHRLAFTVNLKELGQAFSLTPADTEKALRRWGQQLCRTRPHIRVSPLPDGRAYQIAYVPGSRQEAA